MKKLTAIFLLAIFLFHFIGYRVVFHLLETQWKTVVQTSLDRNNYDERDLVTITAPLMLPYLSDTKAFERTDGEIVIDGKLYRYVERKIENGQYVLRCLPDRYQQTLEKGKQDFLTHNVDIFLNGATKKNADSKTPVFKLPVTESAQNYFTLHCSLFLGTIKQSYAAYACTLTTFPHQSPGQPPDASYGLM